MWNHEDFSQNNNNNKTIYSKYKYTNDSATTRLKSSIFFHITTFKIMRIFTESVCKFFVATRKLFRNDYAVVYLFIFFRRH